MGRGWSNRSPFIVGLLVLVGSALGEVPLSRSVEAKPLSQQTAAATTTSVVEFPVTTSPSGQLTPATNGDTVVWVDWRNGNADIYGKNVSGGAEFAIVSNTAYQSRPALDGNVVVWGDQRRGNWDIFGKNLPGGAEFAVITRSADQGGPAISGNIVVWTDNRHGTYDIYGKNISTGVEFPVITYTATQRNAKVSGNYVVWEDWRNGNGDIYAKNLSGAVFPVVTNTAYQNSPSISGNIVVWQDYRASTVNPDIYGKNLATGQEFPISVHPSYQGQPAISGNIVVWVDNRSGNYDIRAKNLATGEEIQLTWHSSHQQSPAVSGDIVVWEDYRNGNWDIYGARVTWSTPLRLTNVQATPNPFNPAVGTTISYTLSKEADAALVVVDPELNVLRVIGPVSRPAGPGSFVWNGRTQNGLVVTSGLYVPVIVASDGAQTVYSYVLAIADNGAAPIISNLAANPPNIVPPGSTTITYNVNKGSVQLLLVLDLSGAEVRRIIPGYKRGGPVSVVWDGRNNGGSYVPNGYHIILSLAIDLLGRPGWAVMVVQVGNVASAPPMEDVRKVASVWMEGHRDEISSLVMKELEEKLSRVRQSEVNGLKELKVHSD